MPISWYWQIYMNLWISKNLPSPLNIGKCILLSWYWQTYMDKLTSKHLNWWTFNKLISSNIPYKFDIDRSISTNLHGQVDIKEYNPKHHNWWVYNDGWHQHMYTCEKILTNLPYQYWHMYVENLILTNQHQVIYPNG